MRLPTSCIAFFVTVSASVCFASPPKLDLSCRPPADLFDGGFTVSAVQAGNQIYSVQIGEIRGWLPNLKRFEGTAYLRSVVREDGCEYQLVDDLNYPRIIIELKSSKSGAIEKIDNGSPGSQIVSAPSDRFRQLRCQVSERLIKDLPRCN